MSAGDATRITARITGRLERTFAGRCLGTFVEIQGIDRATALAAQAFTALIPLLLLLTAVLPTGGGDVAGDAIIQRFRLTGEAADDVRSLFARSGEPTIGVLSVVLLLFSALSLTRRMQNLYLQAWRLPPATGVRRSLNAAFGLAALIIEITLLYFARKLIGALPISGVLSWALACLASLVLWTSVPWLLLDRRISWRRLLPSGVLAAIGTACYGVASTVYMPALMQSYSRRYGIFGVTLSLVGWLLVVSLILVAATAVGAEFDRAEESWARGIRSRFRITRASSSVEDEATPARAAQGGRRASPYVETAREERRDGTGPMTMGPQAYELRVAGPVPPELLLDIGALELVEEAPCTILRTEPIDQSGLHGIMQRLRTLGLDLLEVRSDRYAVRSREDSVATSDGSTP